MPALPLIFGHNLFWTLLSNARALQVQYVSVTDSLFQMEGLTRNDDQNLNAPELLKFINISLVAFI